MTNSDRSDTETRIGNSDRVVVIGTSGAGKTTMARKLAQTLDRPHIEFDAYRHGPNWTETPDDLFREQLKEALQGDRWVADGNYGVARDVVWPRATTLVWLVPYLRGHVEAVLEDDAQRSLPPETVERQQGEPLAAPIQPSVAVPVGVADSLASSPYAAVGAVPAGARSSGPRPPALAGSRAEVAEGSDATIATPSARAPDVADETAGHRRRNVASLTASTDLVYNCRRSQIVAWAAPTTQIRSKGRGLPRRRGQHSSTAGHWPLRRCSWASTRAGVQARPATPSTQ